MRYSKCRECGFWNVRRDRYCLNCGVVVPGMAGWQTRLIRRFAWASLWLGPWLIGRRSPSHLREGVRHITERLSVIEGHIKRLSRVREHAVEGAASEARDEVIAAMDEGLAVLQGQSDGYRVRLWEIDLVRWQNPLGAIAAACRQASLLDYDGCERNLSALSRIRRRGEKLLLGWEGSRLVETPDGHAAATRLREALRNCDGLRDTLVTRQAACALSRVTPLGEQVVSAASAVPMEVIDSFNAHAEVEHMYSALGELEEEHARVQSEVIAKLLASGE